MRSRATQHAAWRSTQRGDEYTAVCVASESERRQRPELPEAGQQSPRPLISVATSIRLCAWLPVALALIAPCNAAASATAPPATQAFLGTFNGPTFCASQLRPAGIAALLNRVPRVELPELKIPQMPKPSVQGMCNLAAGGIAGAVASAITCPLEVIKTNLQARTNVGSGLHPLSMASKIIAEQGPKGLYRGLSLSLMGIIPTRACYFWAYGATKEALTEVIGDCPATHMMSAVTAGGLSATVTCPLWMIKTRMQLQGTSLVDTARTIVGENGVRGMYRGLKASYWGLSEGALQFLM